MDLAKAYGSSADVLSRPLANGTVGNTSAFEEVKQGGKRKSLKKSKKRPSKKTSKRKSKKNISRKR